MFLVPRNTVPKVNDFPLYNMKCSGENMLLRGIIHEVSGFQIHFMLYRGNLDYISNSVWPLPVGHLCSTKFEWRIVELLTSLPGNVGRAFPFYTFVGYWWPAFVGY